MSETLILVLAALKLLTFSQHNYTGDEIYYEFPKFWTSTGFCPAGKIEHKEISATLLSDAIRMQLRLISATGNGITHIRIHWLLELIEFEQYTQAGVPIYDFSKLDQFLDYLDDLGLMPVIEFMANPGNVFLNNPEHNDYLWLDFSYQVVKRYLNKFGAKKVLSWRFETWNEPDLLNYNRLNFTIDDYLVYVDAIRQGLNTAGRRTVNSLNFQLRGPAGLFKNEIKHPLCWHILENCNKNLKQCPFDVLTYHRKGNGTDASSLMLATTALIKDIYKKFPALEVLPVSNDEADPIAGWSTPRSFHADVRYAYTLISIVMLHWQAKLENGEYKLLESISHDNAFLSYHPHEFTQRTLLAHFRMNQTEPPHSQFIQKPVFAALALLGKLAPYASALETVLTEEQEKIWLLKTTVTKNEPLYMSWLMIPQKIDSNISNDYVFRYQLPYELCKSESYAYIVEVLAQNETDPAYIWQLFGSPAFPNDSLRELMRLRQTPRLYSTDILKAPYVELPLENLNSPWVILLRVCSNLIDTPKQVQKLTVEFVYHNEVLLTWRDISNSTKCLKSYEIWFRANETSEWWWISQSWHLPFPSFQYSPLDGSSVNGFYKVRGVDIFNRYSSFSNTVEYLEV